VGAASERLVPSPLTLPQGPNQRWPLDFLHDQLSDGLRFRILAMVDNFTRECLALVADTSPSGGCCCGVKAMR
jgi:putative transposase